MDFTDTPEYKALAAAVEAAKGAEASATALLNGLGAYIAAHKTNPAALQALADSLQTPNSDLAAAVATNPIPA